MRLLVVLVMALSLLIFASFGSDAVPKSGFLWPTDDANKKKTSSHVSSSSPLEAVNKLFSNSIKNKNFTVDEMRVVPTGPNPLHNK
ncbi:CLAVATA3/ESR (CLE)-RELATED PROTEIN 22 [Salix purpurea]|uniref:CLAVATA3/ESR (CLE)-RELATED PROTEIN 22 n=1 Tax=Salix purpurea TaxID=77065 RepID=A0A9Q0Q4F0_SALPP|nr:CLAVATA3/ESR (CLE)-RELATED PROTEIN 22 [Salix purpurea]